MVWRLSFPARLRKHNSRGRLVIDRILKGEKVVDVPVMQPTKFDFLIKLKTAKELEVTIPDKLLATADVIE